MFISIGWIATVAGILMYLPQAIKILKLNIYEGISKATFLIVPFGNLFWMLYSAMVFSIPGFVSNLIISIIMNVVIWKIFFKSHLSIYIMWFIFTIIIIIISFNFLFLIKDVNIIFKIIVILISGFGTGFGFLPQIYELFKNKKAYLKISILMSWLVLICNSLWIIYWTDFMLKDTEIYSVLSLIFSILAALCQLFILFKIYFAKRQKTLI